MTYIPMLRPRKEAAGLLQRVARPRLEPVIDDYPTYYPKHVLNVALTVIPCEIHVVDSNGLWPCPRPRFLNGLPLDASTNHSRTHA